MKNLFKLIVLFLLSLNSNSDEVKWVDEQIEAIKPPREGIAETKVSSILDPFIFLKEKKSETNSSIASEVTTPSKSVVPPSEKKFVLDAIINKSALIDGKWYRINDKIDEYTISDINATSVTLSKKGKQIVIATSSKKLNLQIKNKRD
ncbi:MAG: hypothetical protein NTZ60_06340 [Campylobacterales bacterium]|nr:hypothetical protein [Campylobacterales bacterium]